MSDKLEALSLPVAWANGADLAAIEALRYYADGNPRPVSGQQQFNAEHLYMIADQIKRTVDTPVYSQEYVTALLAALKLEQEQSAYYEKQMWYFHGLAASESERCQQQTIADGNEILALERRLQQPIKLPKKFAFVCDYVMDAGEVKTAIQAAGFKVEGE